MAIQRFIVISVTVLLTLFEIGSCHRCYECTTTREQSCADTYRKTDNHIHKTVHQCLWSKNPNINCPDFCNDCIIEDSQCGKSIIDTPEGDVTVRQCFNPFINCETIIAKTNALTTNEKIKHCSSCHGDLCNGVSSVSLSISLTIVILSASCLYYKYE